jgi:nucleoside-triphosphatase THEP1
MECLSRLFREMIEDIVDSDKQLVATISQKGAGLIANLKKRSDAHLFTLARDNQDILFGQIVEALSLWE